MSLTLGTGPLSPGRAGRADPPLPDGGIVYVEPHHRRIEALVGEAVVLSTERALLIHRPGRTLTYAFPPEVVGDLPHDPSPDAPGYVEVPWDAVDVWVEEGRRLVHYPPNPYHRVDCRPTRRRLRVTVAGEVLVDTDDTVILFETAQGPKLYVHPKHVRTDLLRRTSTSSWCNYKGEATWRAAAVGDTVVEDVAWSYEDPLPESTPITGFLSFDATKAQVEAELPVP
jgi:uncharacterized protein (DUF427 family)